MGLSPDCWNLPIVPPSNHYLFDEKKNYQIETTAFKWTFGGRKSDNIGIRHQPMSPKNTNRHCKCFRLGDSAWFYRTFHPVRS